MPERRPSGGLTLALLAVGSGLALFLAWRHWGPVREHPVPAAAEIKQWSPTTCGPAVVGTVLSAFGKSWTREGLERECRLTAFGSSLEDLREALGSHGLRSRGYRALSARALLRVPRPFIAYVGGAVLDSRYATGHFVVVERFWGGRLEVWEPTSGSRRSLSAAELLARGHGWLLAVEE